MFWQILCHSFICSSRIRKPPKLLARLVPCTEKMLCQKERHDGGFHASKTVISTSGPGDFYRRGIEKLVERWEEVVNNN